MKRAAENVMLVAARLRDWAKRMNEGGGPPSPQFLDEAARDLETTATRLAKEGAPPVRPAGD